MDKKEKSLDQHDYHTTDAYQKADPAGKRQLERYKAAQNISDAQLFLLLHLADVKATPEEQKKAANRPAETMIVSGILFFLVAINIGQRTIMLISIALLFFLVFLYLTGNLSTYTYELKMTRKRLKQYPAVLSFEKWNEQNPEPQPAPAAKAKGKKKN